MLPKPALILLDAILYVALHANVKAVSSKQISQALGLSDRYLEPILQPLVKEGILRSVRGPMGGYILAKERRKILLADLFHLSSLMEKQEYVPTDTMGYFMDEYDQVMMRFLKERNIEDLCAMVGKSVSKNQGDFAI